MNGITSQGSERGGGRFLSLRTKFVGFISLIIVAICSSLSSYFIQNKTDSMTNQMANLGAVLVKNLAYNSRYGLITEDRLLLERLVAGAMEVDEVAYVVITGPDGKILAAGTKGMLTYRPSLTRSPAVPLYPDPSVARALLDSDSSNPVVTAFLAGEGNTFELRRVEDKGRPAQIPLTAVGGEPLYDFAVPVRRAPPQALPPPLSLESQELRQEQESRAAPPVKPFGVVQIGLSGEKVRLALNAVIWNIVWITVVIILCGIVATVVLARQVIGPLRQLAGVARRVAEGDLTASVVPTTSDEVGQLTRSFNQMTQSLKDRDLAISANIETITARVKELSALNQTAAAITSTLDIDKLLTTVLRLLVENLGFKRMLLMLYDGDRRLAYGTRVAGVSEEVERAARDIEIPVQDDGSIQAELLLRGHPILATDLAMVAERIYPPLLILVQQVGVTSFVCAPLKSQQRILGYVGADKGDQPCAQQDLDLLMTVAGTIGVAIDNALAYQQLEHLTQTLERRVEQRTQELQTANVKLQELDALKSAFVSIVSHELRTPMTSIKGYVENMLEGLAGGLTERQSYYLSRVKYNIERLTRLINDLLDLSRIEAGRVELRLGPVQILELVTEVVESAQPMAREKSLTVREVHQGELPLIEGDRDKLLQILTNLVQNAIKFTPKGGQVLIESQARDDGFVQVCVADTGCGIPPHELDRVFERFYRGETGPTEGRGAGLGLAISKSLVELHGGGIWATSTVGQGSRFYFTLPILSPSH